MNRARYVTTYWQLCHLCLTIKRNFDFFIELNDFFLQYNMLFFYESGCTVRLHHYMDTFITCISLFVFSVPD